MVSLEDDCNMISWTGTSNQFGAITRVVMAILTPPWLFLALILISHSKIFLATTKDDSKEGHEVGKDYSSGYNYNALNPYAQKPFTKHERPNINTLRYTNTPHTPPIQHDKTRPDINTPHEPYKPPTPPILGQWPISSWGAVPQWQWPMPTESQYEPGNQFNG